MSIKKLYLILTLVSSFGLYASQRAVSVEPENYKKVCLGLAIDMESLREQVDTLVIRVTTLEQQNAALVSSNRALETELESFMTQEQEFRNELHRLNGVFNTFRNSKNILSEDMKISIKMFAVAEMQKMIQSYTEQLRRGQDAQEERIQGLVTTITALIDEVHYSTLQNEVSNLLAQIRRLKLRKLHKVGSNDTLVPESITSVADNLDELDDTFPTISSVLQYQDDQGPPTRRSSEALDLCYEEQPLSPVGKLKRVQRIIVNLGLMAADPNSLASRPSDGRLTRTRSGS